MMPVSVNKSLLSFILVAIFAGSIFAESQLAGDLNKDYRVNNEDLRAFSWQWLDPDCLVPGCTADFDGVNGVNLSDLAILAGNWQLEEPHLVISEFLASNGSNKPPLPPKEGDLLDGNGDSSDWIEIYNPSGDTVQLDGWYLTDNDSNLTKWQFPDGLQVKPGEFLIVFASKKTYEENPYNYPYLDSLDYYHTNFELNQQGDYLALVAPDGVAIVHEYGQEYPDQLTDVSYGLTQYASTLVSAGAMASYHVPISGDGALGTTWADVTFDDSTWDTGKTGLGFGVGGPPRVAYNDVIYQSGQTIASNVTTYCVGGGSPGPTSGPLLDLATGEDTGITVSLSQSGGVSWTPSSSTGGSDCAVGTDAYNTFGGITDMTGVLTYGSTGWWVDLVFTGLNPTTEYTFATSANRGNSGYTNRLAIYTLTGADTYANASTIGVDVLAENKVRYNTGYNYDTGYVARWTGITAADGSFSVRAEADPSSEGGYRAYSFDVFKLEGGFSGTDVKNDMLGVNASLWMRSEFNLEIGTPELFDTLTLRMKYEDGFVAYLNGQQVCSRNAPGTLHWNSIADSNRPTQDSSVFEVINLTAYLGTLQAGKNVLAIHALNDDSTDTNFLILPELNAASNMSVPQYFTTPTPGTFNIPGAIGVASEVGGSHKRGFHSSPFQLILSTGDDNAEIRYTTDG
ncbi:MAG: lamin tail domain-containing protein, partial [Planctomycetota bacterium]